MAGAWLPLCSSTLLGCAPGHFAQGSEPSLACGAKGGEAVRFGGLVKPTAFKVLWILKILRVLRVQKNHWVVKNEKNLWEKPLQEK